jgi:hypothetical protein
MHRSIRWLVGTLASILGLGLLLVGWGLWASDSRLVVENTPPVRSMLIAAQNEPAFLMESAAHAEKDWQHLHPPTTLKQSKVQHIGRAFGRLGVPAKLSVDGREQRTG